MEQGRIGEPALKFRARAGYFIAVALTILTLAGCSASIRVVDESAPIAIRDASFPRETTSVELTGLDLGDDEIRGVGKLTRLKTLVLWGNDITDVTELSNLTELEHLDLFNNSVTDIAPLSSLTSLEYLDISWNPIDDLAPLYALTNLKTLEISEDGWTDAERASLEAALPECEIIWEK